MPRILIVEDELLVAEDLAATLEELGEIIGVASSGEESVRMAEDLKPDLILMDIELGGAIDGIEAAEQIVSRFDIPVVYVTAYTENSVFQRAKTTGPYAYIGKPFSEQDLRNTVRMVLFKHEADRRLKQSEEKYRTLVETIPNGIVEVDVNGTITGFNSSYRRMVEYGAEELTGKAISDLIGSDSEREGVGRYLTSLVRNQPKITPWHGRHVAKTGRIVDVQVDWNYKRDSLDNVIGFIAVVTDIAERKRAEDLLLVEKKRFEVLAENSPSGLVMIGKDGTFDYVNPKFKELFGYDLSEVPNGREWFRKAFPDPAYRHKVIASWTEDLESYGPGEQRPRTFTVRCKDGTDKVINFRPVQIDAGSHLVSCQDITREKKAEEALKKSQDELERRVEQRTAKLVAANKSLRGEITERKRAQSELKRSEERYRSLFNDSKDGVYVSTRDGRFLEVNQALCNSFGYTQEELIGLNVSELYADNADRERFKRSIEQASFVKDYEVKLLRKDGVQLDCLLTSSVWRDEGGSIAGYRGILRDVTDRNLLQEQLVQAQKMESVATLAGGVAHDFNNLLTVITGYAELGLDRLNNGESGYDEFEVILNAAERGADLVKQMLTFSRKMETKAKPINLNHQVELAQKLLYKTIPKMIRIKTRLADDLMVVNADPIQMEQVLVNLAVNARDAMPDGGELVFKTHNVVLDREYCARHVAARPGPHVLLTVSDTGHGMDKELVDRIFEPFFSTKKPKEGTGLGLSMVFGIVKSHGGHISCFSERGVGTTFNLYLPAFGEAAKSDSAKPKESEVVGTETILFVDDEDLIRELGKNMLTKRGFTVLTAGDGKEALEIFRSRQSEISLVILDVIMPEMGGTECLEKLLHIDPKVKVLIASGFSPDKAMKEALEIGAMGFVSKPFHAHKFVRTVRQILDA